MSCTTEKYSWPSSVNVANFVTVKPDLKNEERSMNFNVWKKQMMCLLESQDVAGFINGEIVEPQQSDEQKLWRRSDSLVQGWILGSIGADVLPKVCCLETARKVWLELEKIFNGDKTSVSEIQPSEELNTSNIHQLTVDCTNEKYTCLSSVNVANFVTVRPQLTDEIKLRWNFTLWREQMLCLLKSQDVVGFINGETKEPQKSDEQKLWRRSDSLLKGWILGSIGTDVLQYICDLVTSHEVWYELHYIFNSISSAEMGNVWPSINVAKVVTVRPQLNEEERSMIFSTWKEQMLCLLKFHDLVGFIEDKTKEPLTVEQKLWRSTDRLVKFWILGSIGTDVLQKLCELECELETARNVWLELDNIFNPNPAASQVSTDYRNYLPLFNAALRGDWKTANELFFEKNSEETEAFITEDEETALHVAVRSRRANVFVQNLVQMMRPEALAIRNSDGCTALHEAAIVGNTKAARALLEKNRDLLYMLAETDDENSMAIDYASGNEQKETLVYLISESKPNMKNCAFEGQRGLDLLIEIICCDFIDVALDLVKKYPNLARLRDSDDGRSALTYIDASVFESSESFSWLEKLIYSCVPVKQSESRPTSVAGDIVAPTYCSSFPIINGVGKQCKTIIWKVMEHIVPGVKDIKDKKKLHNQALEIVTFLCHEMKSLPPEDSQTMLQDSMMCAAEYGISEIVEVIIEMHPALASSVDDNDMTIMHLAVSGRFENVFNLIYKMIDRKQMFLNCDDNKSNSLLHMCARLPNPERLNIVTGAALQMQRELQWFNEVERFIPPSYRKLVNADDKTAKVLFTEEHRTLREQGERWMKDTANACSIATALIATVVFAASFTVPGGVKSETGIPVFFEEPAFVLFATTNAVSLFTSITSLLLFLSILTSRFAEQDFLHVLPKRLSFGLFTLFISITFMLLAFSAAFYLLFNTKLVCFIIPVIIFGWLPVASFVRLQFPLLVDVVYSTYGPGIFKKHTREIFD